MNQNSWHFTSSPNTEARKRKSDNQTFVVGMENNCIPSKRQCDTPKHRSGLFSESKYAKALSLTHESTPCFAAVMKLNQNGIDCFMKYEYNEAEKYFSLALSFLRNNAIDTSFHPSNGMNSVSSPFVDFVCSTRLQKEHLSNGVRPSNGLFDEVHPNFQFHAQSTTIRNQFELVKQGKEVIVEEYDEGLYQCTNIIHIPFQSNDISATTIIMFNIGQTHIQQQKYQVACDWFIAASNMSQQKCENLENSVLIRILNGLGYCFLCQGFYKKAIYYYEMLLSMTEEPARGSSYEITEVIADAKNAFANTLCYLNRIYRPKTVDAKNISSRSAQATASWSPSDKTNDLPSYKKALRLFEESLELYGALKGWNSKEVGTLYSNMGCLLYLNGFYTEAAQKYEEALKIRRLLNRNVYFPFNFAVTVCNLGQSYHQLRRLDDALQMYLEFLSMMRLETSSETLKQDEVAIMKSAGSIYQERGELRNAKDMYQLSLHGSQSLFGRSHPIVATLQNKLGTICYQLNDLHGALKYHQDGLYTEKIIYGSQHPNVIITLMNIAQIYRDLNDMLNAFTTYEEVLELQQGGIRAKNTNNPIQCMKAGGNLCEETEKKFMDYCNARALSNTLFSMGLVLYRMNSFSSSFAYYSRSLRLKRLHYGKDAMNKDIASTLNLMGITLFQMKQYSTAKQYFLNSLHMRRTLHGNEHKDVAVTLYNLATSDLELGNDEGAATLYKETLRIERLLAQKKDENNDEVRCQDLIQTLQHLGLVEQQGGKLSDALDYFTEALEIERQQNPNKPIAIGLLLNLIGNIHLQRGNVSEMMHYYTEASRILNTCGQALFIAGYNFFCFSKLHPECAGSA